MIGATGNVGRSLLAALPEARPVSRASGADLADPPSLRAAFAGADALFLMVPGAGEHLDIPAILAEARHIPKIVLLSSQAAGTRPGEPAYEPFRRLEDQVKAAAERWTVLRPGGFASNAFAWAGSIRAERKIYTPYADIGLPVVDPADIAAVAAVALGGGTEGLEGQTYVLTGPERTTPRERAHRIGEVLGGPPIEVVELEPAEARTQMLTFMPEAVADGTLAILGHPKPDEQAVSPAVHRLLGRPPGTFTDWARRHVTAFR